MDTKFFIIPRGFEPVKTKDSSYARPDLTPVVTLTKTFLKPATHGPPMTAVKKTVASLMHGLQKRVIDGPRVVGLTYSSV